MQNCRNNNPYMRRANCGYGNNNNSCNSNSCMANNDGRNLSMSAPVYRERSGCSDRDDALDGMSIAKAVFGEFNVIEVESEEVIDSVIGWHYETIPTDALSKCEPFCYSMPLTEDYVKRCKMKVIGNIWDKSEDAKPKETDNIIYHDFTKKGRE